MRCALLHGAYNDTSCQFKIVGAMNHHTIIYYFKSHIHIKITK